MEFFFDDPNIQRLPPAETRILDLHVEPYPDGQRLRVALKLTPFQQRPCIDLTLRDDLGNETGSVSIIEPANWILELTMHVKKSAPTAGRYSLSARLSFPDLDEADQREITFSILEPSP